MSISNLLIADLRALNQDITHNKLFSTLKTLNQSWDPNDVMPPYIDIIANLFPANIMRKPTNGPPKSSGQFGHKKTYNAKLSTKLSSYLGAAIHSRR